MEEKGVPLEMITLEPIMELFTNLVPIQYSHLLFDSFFKFSWRYFYSLFLVFLDEIEEDLLKDENQAFEIVKIVKAYSQPQLVVVEKQEKTIMMGGDVECVKIKD